MRRVLQTALGALLLAVVWWPGMNYFGYCHASGKFLTEREKIDAAIEDAISPYPPPLARTFEQRTENPSPLALLAIDGEELDPRPREFLSEVPERERQRSFRTRFHIQRDNQLRLRVERILIG
jgi:hypothetical protein